MRWRVERSSVSDDGLCRATRERLRSLELSEDEQTQLCEGTVKIACQGRGAAQAEAFEEFKSFVSKKGPFQAVLDAANIAMSGSDSSRSGRFSISQLRTMVEHVQEVRCMSTLVVLHRRWVQQAEADATAKEHLEAIRESLYCPRPGVNDDWYWLYAAVVGGKEAFVVSNDLMRDHLFNITASTGAPKHFNKWKERHQVKYQFSGGIPLLSFPKPYSECSQHSPDSGTWYFPLQPNEPDHAIEEWLVCAMESHQQCSS